MPLIPGTQGAELRQRIGEELAVSDWIVIEQARIDAFAETTGDHYWIHTDIDRAKAGPLGTTIAHGFLTLSLVAPSCLDVVLGVLGAKQVLNYGVEGVRFTAPVRSGSRVRCRVRLGNVSEKSEGRFLIDLDCVVDIEGEDRSALVGHTLMLITL